MFYYENGRPKKKQFYVNGKRREITRSGISDTAWVKRNFREDRMDSLWTWLESPGFAESVQMFRKGQFVKAIKRKPLTRTGKIVAEELSLGYKTIAYLSFHVGSGRTILPAQQKAMLIVRHSISGVLRWRAHSRSLVLRRICFAEKYQAGQSLKIGTVYPDHPYNGIATSSRVPLPGEELSWTSPQ